MIEYVNQAQFAMMLGVSRQYVSVLLRNGVLPEPDARVLTPGGRTSSYVWKRETAERFAKTHNFPRSSGSK